MNRLLMIYGLLKYYLGGENDRASSVFSIDLDLVQVIVYLLAVFDFSNDSTRYANNDDDSYINLAVRNSFFTSVTRINDGWRRIQERNEMRTEMKEEKLEKIYQHIESAVFGMSSKSEMKVNEKYEIIDNFFAEIMQRCDVEQVD